MCADIFLSKCDFAGRHITVEMPLYKFILSENTCGESEYRDSSDINDSFRQ